MNLPSKANLFILNNITHIASLLLLCVSRYAAVAKNSHCTQSYSKYVVSYHAHCEPFAPLRISIRGGCKKLTLHAILFKMSGIISRMLRAFCSFAYLDTRQSQKTHTARNLTQNALNHITHIDCPAKGLSIGIHCAPRGTAVPM